MMLPTAYLRPLIAASAQQLGLPWWRSYPPDVWLEAVILQESAGNPKARRYEAHQDQPGRRDAADDADNPAKDDGQLEDDASYGLMQIMGYNARRLVGAGPGTALNFGFLLLPITNIAFGLRILLAELQATSGNVARALARYNGGPTGDAPGPNGTLRRQVYVDGVAAHADRVLRERK